MSKKKVEKARKKISSSRMVVSSIFFIISALLLFSIGQEILTTINLSKDLQELNQQLKVIENETRDLNERKEKLEDPNYIKSYARGEYSITKEGEQVFRLPSSNNKNKEPEEESTEPSKDE